jgi:precorrin-2 methylase
MAYLKELNKEIEIDFPMESVWEAIPKAVAELDWEIQDKEEEAHRLMINTAGNLTSYGSMLKVELKQLNQKTTSMVVVGETPVTTITSTLDFTQTYGCIDDFVLTLAEVMNR